MIRKLKKKFKTNNIYEILVLLLLPAGFIIVPFFLAFKKILKLKNLSFLGRTDLSRGIRNNNPFNLKNTSISWKGEIGGEKKSDTVFEQFSTIKFGIRAGLMQIRNDIKRGNNTLNALLYKFAPSHENNTKAYIQFVINNTNIVSDIEILYPNKETVLQIGKAIVKYENGEKDAKLIPDRLYDLAYLLL